MLTSIRLIFHRLIEQVPVQHYRYLYHQLQFTSRLTGIVGARGVGKTTLLLQWIKNNFPNNKNVFYVSADHIYFSRVSLYEFVEELYLSEGVRYFFIDEIHKYKNWNQELKNLYDGFPDLYIVFSGSSSLDLIRGSYDLSRRAKLYHLAGMSFREFLNFKTTANFQPIIFEDLIQQPEKYNQFALVPRIKGLFVEYLRQGYYPFQDEDPLNYQEKILNVVDKTIFEDIANFYNLKTENLIFFKRILSFLANIEPGSVSVHNIAKNLSLDDKTVIGYILNMADTGLINLIYPAEGGNLGLRRPLKIFLQNTNLQYTLTGELNRSAKIGTVRELFFIQNIMSSGLMAMHSKVGDYTVKDKIFEIGGKNKTMQQIKTESQAYLVKDDILLATKQEIPLMLFGFLY